MLNVRLLKDEDMHIFVDSNYYTYIKNEIRWFFRAMPQLSANLHTQMTLNLSDTKSKHL